MISGRYKVIILICLITIFFLSGCSGRDSSIEDIPITYSPLQTQKALDFALSRQGKPYVYGGNGPDEFDCSGLVIWSYQQVDNDLRLKIGNDYYSDATIDDIYNFNIVHIVPTRLRPGDIVFFTHVQDRIAHGGLFIEWIDNNSFRYIHASSSASHREVTVDTWNLDQEYYQWFAGAGRLKLHKNF